MKVNLWAVGEHNCIMSLRGHSTPVECVQFGRSEEQVCAGSRTGALKIWNLEAAKIVGTLNGHTAAIRCMDFDVYGCTLASGSLDTSIKMWDTRQKRCSCTYKAHCMTVNSLKFSPDRQWIASGGDDGLVKLWDIKAGRHFKEFSDHTGPITAVEFHPSEFMLASSSCDRSVNFWDLENFQLVSTTAQDVGAIRCIYFSQGGECLYAGSRDVLKVYDWEPARTYDTIPMGWGKIQDIATAQNQLIGASFQLTNVMLYAVDLKRVQPFCGEPDGLNPSPFFHGQSFRKSFNQEKPLSVSKAALNIKAIEEYDRSGTDPEDEPQSMAHIQNMKVYQVFQPNRRLARTPPPVPFPAPIEDDPSMPQILQPPLSDPEGPVNAHNVNGVELRGTSFHQLLPGVTVRAPPSPPSEPAVMNDEPSHQASISPYAKHNRVRRLSITRDLSSFPEVDFPVRLGNMRYSPSEPALNQLNSSHARSLSLSRNLASLNPETSKSNCYVQNSTTVSAYSKPATANTAVHKPVAPSSLPAEISVSQVRVNLAADEEEKEREDFIPVGSGKHFNLDLEDFLPKNYSNTFGYQQTLLETEGESLSSLLGGHDFTMKIMVTRQRNLGMTYSVCHSREIKAAIDSAVALKDLAVVMDILNVIMHEQSVWNLDLCVVLLPSIFDLIQSKYEEYMTVGCESLKLILRNFAQVINTNLHAPIQTLGVDIPREERYNKCMKCHNSLITIRTFLLKRQTLPGKLGQTFRELLTLMQSVVD